MNAILLLVLAAALSGNGAASDATILTADQGKIAASDLAMSATGDVLTLDYTAPEGNRRQLRCDEIVEIRISRSRRPRAPGDSVVEVELTSGDRIVGTLLEGGDSTVRVRSELLGEVEAEFNRIRAIRSVKNAADVPPAPEKAAGDVVFRKGGEKGRGVLIRVGADRITYHSEILDREVNVAPKDFAAAFLTEMPGSPKPAEPRTLFAIVLSKDGSTLQGKIGDLKEGVLSLKDFYGAEQAIEQARIASIYFKNGRVVYLSDRKPSAVDENANYIRGEKPLPSDLVIPWRRDRNAKGDSLVLEGKAFRKGIGVHAFSSLTWDVSGAGFKRFHATIGLDDCGGRLGHVVFRVLVDGEKRFERAVDGADAPAEISVDVSGGGRLELVVGFGERANQADYADWASARLIR
ncbi:MAG: NPCBM/NEW2 domain-containing protein [Planctomycetota bacterium]|jgi:hypothetical protein